jgi:predicted patatin/cPLA2 family phospholipase
VEKVNKHENRYNKICKEIESLKKQMHLENISDSQIAFETIAEEHPILPWAFNMKRLVSLIDKKFEYESFVKDVALNTFGKLI